MPFLEHMTDIVLSSEHDPLLDTNEGVIIIDRAICLVDVSFSEDMRWFQVLCSVVREGEMVASGHLRFLRFCHHSPAGS